MAKSIFYDGSVEDVPARIPLRAGPLRLIYEAGDLRSICLGKFEILRRIYVAVRDRNWGTVLPVLTNVKIQSDIDSFQIRYQVENHRDEIDFVWQGSIRGEADGSITFRMDGEARSTFLKNRIGFCVLHPASSAGTPCRVEHIDGRFSDAVLPVYIVPDQPVMPFAEMRALTHRVCAGVWARVILRGDTFEMEDQRNWTDASYKTFCTPLHLPFPVEIAAGTSIMQQVDLSLQMEEDKLGDFRSEQVQDVEMQEPIRLVDGAAVPVPLLGLGTAEDGPPLTLQEIERLRALSLDHLRVDLHLDQPGGLTRLQQIAHEAQLLGIGIEVALHVPEKGGANQLAQLAVWAQQHQPPVRAWLVYAAEEKYAGGSAIRQAVEQVCAALKGVISGAMIAAGTNTDLIFFQRNVPPTALIDQVTFAICPQVHAFDNASLVETLEAQPQAVQTAQFRADGKPVRVSPITLKMRFNPYATGGAVPVVKGQLPPTVDVRQGSLFGAGWTLGSMRALALARAASLTYYETTGWRGIMEMGQGCPEPQLFHSAAGGVYPMYFIFRAAADFAGGEITPLNASTEQVVSGMVFKLAGRTRAVVANHTFEKQMVCIATKAQQGRVKILDETTVEAALRAPEVFWERIGPKIQSSAAYFWVTLLPFAVAWVDAVEGEDDEIGD